MSPNHAVISGAVDWKPGIRIGEQKDDRKTNHNPNIFSGVVYFKKLAMLRDLLMLNHFSKLLLFCFRRHFLLSTWKSDPGELNTNHPCQTCKIRALVTFQTEHSKIVNCKI
jgi:hypothetical protein